MFWIAFVLACNEAGRYFHTDFFTALAFTAVFVFGNYFIIHDRKTTYLSPQNGAEPSRGLPCSTYSRALPLLIGAAWALFVGSGIGSWTLSADPDTRSMLLIGMPYELPVGALFFGTMAPMGYCFGVDRIGRRFSACDFLPIIAMSILTFAVAQITSFIATGAWLFASLYAAYPGTAPGSVLLDVPLARSAPTPGLTVPLEAAAFLVGGFVAFLRQIPEDTPWSSAAIAKRPEGGD